MRKALLVILAVGIGLSAFAQATQPCVVMKYNKKEAKSPLSGVEVWVNNAGSKTSDEKGELTLVFRTLKPGDRVSNVQANKGGYVIFNTEAVEQWFISRDQTPFTLVLVDKAYFEQLKSTLTQTSTDNYRKKYEQAVKELEQQREEGRLKDEEYNQKYDELDAQLRDQLNNLDNYIDRFARIDLSNVSDAEQRILDMVQEGKIEEAVQAYEDLKLEEKLKGEVADYLAIKKAVRQLEESEGQKKNNIETLYTSIKREISTMILADKFSEAKNRLVSALDDFLLLMEEDPATARPKVVDFQNQLGDLLHYYSYFTGVDKRLAIPYYESALANYEILAADNPDTYFEAIAQTKTNLGILKEYVMDEESAESYYLGALAICERLLDQDAHHRGQVASAQWQLGELYLKWRGRTEDAEHYLLAALENYMVLNQEDPDSYLADLASIHMSLADVYTSKRDIDKAEQSLKTAESQYSLLIEKGNQGFIDSLEKVQEKLALHYGYIIPLVGRDDKEYVEKAEYYYLAICNTAMKQNSIKSFSPLDSLAKSRRYGASVSTAWMKLIKFYLRQKEYEKAETKIADYIKICDDLYPNQRERVKERTSIGKAFITSGYPEKGLPYCLEARTLYEQQWPEDYEEIGQLCMDLSVCYAFLKESSKMESSMSDAFACFDSYYYHLMEFVGEEQGTLYALYLQDIINAVFSMEVLVMKLEVNASSIFLGSERIDSAFNALDLCFQKEKAEFLLRHAANEYSRIATAQYNVGETYLNMGDYREAEQWLGAALESIENQTIEESDQFDKYSQMADIQKSLGYVYYLDDNPKAESILLQSIQNYYLAEIEYSRDTSTFSSGDTFDENQYKDDIAFDQRTLGYLYYFNNDNEKAEVYLKESLINAELYFRTHKDMRSYPVKEIARTQYRLMIVSSRLSKPDEYDGWLDIALEKYDYLYKAKPDDGNNKERLEELLLRKGWREAEKDRPDSAFVLFNRVYDLDNSLIEDLASGYNTTAYSYARTNDYDMALETIDKAISLQPNDANYYDSKGEILLMSGDEQGALEMWRKVLELEPDFLSKHNGSTPLYEQLKEKGLIE